MIDAKELRIGNNILPQHDLDGKYHVVVSLNNKSINSYIEDWYSGIPLTHEILEKCGFIKWASNFHKPGCDFHLDEEFYAIFGVDGEEMPYKTVGLKYLHQLQNLYFDLTEEELQCTL